MNDNNLNRGPESTGEEVIDLRKLFATVLLKWRWFFISVPLCVLIALLICFKSTPIWQVTSKVMVSDSKRGELGASAMMKELGFMQGGDMFVENEMVELQSRNLMREVVKDLGLNVLYFQDGLFRERELYNNSPVTVHINNPQSVSDTIFYVESKGENAVRLTNENGKVLFEGNYGELIILDQDTLTIESNNIPWKTNKIKVSLGSYDHVTSNFHKALSVSLLEKNTNAVLVTVKDAIPDRGKDIVTSLIVRYNENAIADNRKVSDNTAAFIDERLKVINGELGTIESSAESFKIANRLTDITTEAQMMSERKKMAEAEILKLNTELSVVKSIRNYLITPSADKFRLLPQMELTDVGLSSGIEKYNELVLQLQRLLQSASETNPRVVGLVSQLEGMRNNIQATVQSVEKNLSVKIRSIEQENRSVSRMIADVPTQEKKYRGIARQQELKETLYLFLLQKREETQIAKLMFVSTAKIIEDPRAGEGPIAPKKSLILLVGLILGFGLPVGLILLLEAMDTKIRNVEDVEKVIKSPLLGSLPELPSEKTDVFQDNFIMSESLHLIREKLNYMLQGKECPLIMVTSTMPSEGKSLVSAHLAYAYAKAGKKVLAIGCDLRNPQMDKFFMKVGKKGLSAYLAGMENDPHNVMLQINEHLTTIFGGAVPPNPTQLIASPRLGELLNSVRKEFDYIILDTPPLGILADGFSINKFTDACVYVVRANVLDKRALKILADLEKENRLTNLGIVVNDIKTTQSRFGYGYGYGYGYGKYGYGQTPKTETTDNKI